MKLKNKKNKMETSQTMYLHRMFVVFVIAHSPIVRLRNKKTKKENRGLGRTWAWKGGAVFIRVPRKTRKVSRLIHFHPLRAFMSLSFLI